MTDRQPEVKDVTPLQARLEKAIEEKNFNFLEMVGFSASPRLALMAGAAIGYGLALADQQNKLLQIVDAIEKGENK